MATAMDYRLVLQEPTRYCVTEPEQETEPALYELLPTRSNPKNNMLGV